MRMFQTLYSWDYRVQPYFAGGGGGVEGRHKIANKVLPYLMPNERLMFLLRLIFKG